MDQNWAELLDFIYTHDQEWKYFSKGDTGINDEHPFVTDTALTPAEAKAAYSFLERNELIEESGSKMQLTKKGFDVAREREMNQSRLSVNRMLMFLTAVLALSAIAEILLIIFL